MRFINGYWMTKEGYKFIHPMEGYEILKEDNELIIYAPAQQIQNKGQTLDGGLLTFKISSPIEGVIRVKAVHHEGTLDNKPKFDIKDEKISGEINENEKLITYKTGDLKAEINKECFSIKFYDKDKLITSSENRATAHVTTDIKECYMREELSIGVGENIYGLGERFTSFIKNGQTVDIWNEDGGTASDQAYKNIPFYVSNKGYGVFVNDTGKVSFEVASEKVSRVQFSVKGEEIEYFIISGPTLKKVIERYTDLLGKPALVPAWSFGLWLSTSFLTDYDEETVNSFIDGMIERDIPLDVFHFDCLWMKEFEWCNFQWDERMFPDPQGMLKRLKDKGLKTCVWINPYIGQKSSLFKEGKEKGYFLKREDGSVWQWDLWQAGNAFVDFTNREACAWYEEKLEKLIDMGVTSFKTDFGERIPKDGVYYNGYDGESMHNYYTYLYNKVVYDLLERKLGKNEAVLFARSATAGGQKFPVHWGGDCMSSYPSMAESLRGGLSFSLSGFAYWSHDIGGFENGTSPDLYKRWTQFGLLSSHSRYHGSGEYKVPWIYDEEAVEVTRYFSKLKCSLMPYLYKHAVEASKVGIPMMRPMVLEFMEDETCGHLDRQYMLGENLMVAPIFNEEGEGRYYLPEGIWTNFITNEVRDGGRWYQETYDYFSLPLMVRENSIIVTGEDKNSAVYDYTKNITFNIFELEDNVKSSVEVIKEKSLDIVKAEVIKKDNKIKFSIEGSKGMYSIILRNIYNVETKDGNVKKTDLGVEIKTDKNVVEINL